jgi:hypothetical protein
VFRASIAGKSQTTSAPKVKEMELKSNVSSKSSEKKRKAKQSEKFLARQQEIVDRLCLQADEDDYSDDKSGDFCKEPENAQPEKVFGADIPQTNNLHFCS